MSLASEGPDASSSEDRADHLDERARLRQTRAVRLLTRLVDEHAISEELLATQLVTSPAMIRAFKEGRRQMDLRRQLCVALLAIESVPPLASEGYRLRGQVAAAMRYENRKEDAR